MDSEEQLQKEFDRILEITNQFEDKYPGDDELSDLIETYQKLQKQIIGNNIFSPNEEFSEIQTEHLKFILLPYYMGWALTQVQEWTCRRKNLETSNYCIEEFIKLLKQYELLDEYQLALWKKVQKEKTIQRDDKLRNYKEQKQLDYQVQNLQKLDDAKQQRDIIKLQFKYKVYKSFDILVSNAQELEILKFKEQLEKDKQVKEKYNEQQQKPIPKMKVWNIPKPQQQTDKSSYFDPLCHQCKSEAEMRQQAVAEVWQPNPARLPNMTLDEFADMEIKFAKDQEAIMKKAQKEQEEIEKDKDDDKEFWTDQQTLKDRSWDDWKDDNEKGAGNKMGR